MMLLRGSDYVSRFICIFSGRASQMTNPSVVLDDDARISYDALISISVVVCALYVTALYLDYLQRVTTTFATS